MCYIDDIIIFSKTFNDHLTHITQVMNRILASRLKQYILGHKLINLLLENNKKNHEIFDI